MSLEKLPNEILLDIFQTLQDITSITLTNKRFFELGTNIRMQRVESLHVFFRVGHMSERIIPVTKSYYLLERFLDRCQTHICEAPESDLLLGRVILIIKLMWELWCSTRVTEKYFFRIQEKYQALLIDTIEKANYQEAMSVLEIMERLPYSTGVHDNYFIGIAQKCQCLLAQAIKEARYQEAMSVLKIMQRIPWNTGTHDEYFFSISMQCQYLLTCVIEEASYQEAMSVLEIMEKLPYSTGIHDDNLIGIARKCQCLLARATKEANHQEVSLIRQIIRTIRNGYSADSLDSVKSNATAGSEGGE